MKKAKKVLILLTALALTFCMTGVSFAQTHSFNGACAYDGKTISGDFTSDTFAASQSQLEPGDDLEYTIKYTNNGSKTTKWYMLNSVLETLEEQKDAAEHGGYTYTLKNIGPDGKETILFNNSEVGGDKVVGKLKGLYQATTSTGDYFFIQELKPGQTGTTYIYVQFDGETEVNDYMDTYGKLRVAYAVEDKTKAGPPDDDSKKKLTTSETRTGDSTSILKWVLLMTAALLGIILTIVSWRRDRKDGEKA